MKSSENNKESEMIFLGNAHEANKILRKKKMQDCFELYTAAFQQREMTLLTQLRAWQNQGSFTFVSLCVFTLFFLQTSPYILAANNAVRDDSRTKHNTQLHTWQPSFFGIGRRTFFFCLFCRFHSFEALNTDFLAAAYRRSCYWSKDKQNVQINSLST